MNAPMHTPIQGSRPRTPLQRSRLKTIHDHTRWLRTRSSVFKATPARTRSAHACTHPHTAHAHSTRAQTSTYIVISRAHSLQTAGQDSASTPPVRRH
ncbi:hypothetical protein CF327_g375 [Tilletia walkeri]|nr:hypothetical protein CF327_g375 [Tilletia walkeri]